MNKIKSTRTLDLVAQSKKVITLPFLNSPNQYKKSVARIVIDNEEESKSLIDWNHKLLCHSKEYYPLVKSNHPYSDCCFVKLQMIYSTKDKKYTNELKTEIYIKKKKENDLTLEDLNKLLEEHKKCKLTIEASSVYEWDNQKGINYHITKMEFS